MLNKIILVLCAKIKYLWLNGMNSIRLQNEFTVSINMLMSFSLITIYELILYFMKYNLVCNEIAKDDFICSVVHMLFLVQYPILYHIWEL